MQMRWMVVAWLVAAPAWAKRPTVVEPPPIDLSVRWVLHAEEYQAVVAQTYRAAIEAVVHEVQGLPPGARWVVVADLDETLLDNSAYQVEVASTGGFTPESWAKWEERRAAVAMPGAASLATAVHALGGQLAYITNRRHFEGALDVLIANGLWSPNDRLCVRTAASEKAERRASVREGTASCGWEGEPRVVVAYLGDQRGDFPAGDEPGAPVAGEVLWGDRWFMLPNAMYGDWANK